MTECDYVELEHKYRVDSSFEKEQFFLAVRALTPVNDFFVEVDDTYFNPYANNYIFRFRKDRFLEQLTVKDIKNDSEKRAEINLNLTGNSLETVRRFLQPIGIVSEIHIRKKVWVFEFEDVEIVYYIASSQGLEVAVVEIEARNFTSISEGLATIVRYELLLQFDSRKRERRSLYEIYSGNPEGKNPLSEAASQVHRNRGQHQFLNSP